MNSSLDTNILLRYIWKDVPGQREKAAALIDDENQTFYISDMVISELAYNLKIDHLERSTIYNVLMTIIEKRNIVVSDFVREDVLPFFAEHPALSFVDCYAAMEAEKKGREPLFTFDRKLANQCPGAKRA